MATLQGLKEALDIFELRQDFRDLAPKKFIVPNGYMNPRLINVVNYDSLQGEKFDKNENKTRSAGILLNSELLKLNFPVYFVSSALLEVAAETTPPGDVALSAIKWPLNALAFVFPFEHCKKILDVKLFYGLIGKVFVKHDHILTHNMVEELDTSLSWYHSHIPVVEGNKISTVTDEYYELNEVDPETITHNRYSPAHDNEVANKLIKLLYNLVMIMTAQPDLVEAEICIRKPNPAKHTTGLWHPNFLGRNYQHKTDLGGTHASPRMHWRRGHFRHQRFGKELSEVKVIWIEPVLVNP